MKRVKKNDKIKYNILPKNIIEKYQRKEEGNKTRA